MSTVGQYVPPEAVREIVAEARNYDLKNLRGEAREARWLELHGFEEIGFERTYETMVFGAGPPCVSASCGCGMPAIDGCEIDMAGYNNAGDATRGRLALCHAYAEKS